MKICCFVSTLVHDRGCDPLYSISVYFKNLPNHRLSNGLSFQVSTSPLISSPLSFILSLQRQSRPDVQANRQTARCWGQYWRKDAESQIHLYVCVCVHMEGHRCKSAICSSVFIPVNKICLVTPKYRCCQVHLSYLELTSIRSSQ